MGKEPDEIRQEIEETRSRMGETVEAIGYKADVKSRTKESLSSAKNRVVGSVRETKDSIAGTIAGTGETMADSTPSRGQLKQGGRRAVGIAQENPLGLALGSVAVGFLAGMALPTSRVEQEKVAPVATQMREKVEETGQEALDRGRQVAEQTMETAREAGQAAMQQTAETARGSAQEHGQEVSSSARDKLREAGPGGPGSSS